MNNYEHKNVAKSYILKEAKDIQNNNSNKNDFLSNFNDEKFDYYQDSLGLDGNDSNSIYSDLLENDFKEGNKDNILFDLDKFNIEVIIKDINELTENSKKLIGDDKFKIIHEFYKGLQEVKNIY